MTLGEWFNSKPQQESRQAIRGDKRLSMCDACYKEEDIGYESRRIKENFKTIIFTEQAFDRSYRESPFYADFESDTTDRLPIDWHVDLGNECNLACKMCRPRASSKVTEQYNRWNIPLDVVAHNYWQLSESLSNQNWTHDEHAWENFKSSVLAVENLNRIHFMGGEPLLNKKFRSLLDFLLENKPNVSVSFVTNGTLIDNSLIDKLRQFPSCDLEISLDSIHDNNHYIRQGSDTKELMAKIEYAMTQQTDTFKVVLRSVPQLLNMNNYDQYIRYAWKHRVSVQGILLTKPPYLRISVLPLELRATFIERYEQLEKELSQHKTIKSSLATGRNVGELEQQLARECRSIITALREPEPNDVEELRKELCYWITKWDREYNLNARDFYPEYHEFFNLIGYNV